VSKLRDELKQNKPFANLREEAILNVWRTGDFMARHLQQLLKTRGLSQTQYNVLRILRGSGDQGLPSGEIAGRLLTQDPDVTRLMDRLVKQGLAKRTRLRQDRRVVLAKITPAGLAILAELETPVSELIHGLMAHVKDSQLQTLIAVLEEMRSVEQ